jgi:tetratricopeptide (TPR) repeat protein
MIVKNEELGLPLVLQSLPGQIIDEIVVVDTGSEDRTVQEAKAFDAMVHHYEDPDPIEIDGSRCLSDFAAARNFAFSKCSGDFILWIDGDDYFFGAQEFARHWLKQIDFGRTGVLGMSYDYEHDEEGNCIMRHPRERIVRAGTHVWRSPIHEVLCALRVTGAAWIPPALARIVHNDCGENRQRKARRNAAVAERFIARSGNNVEARMWLNYGNSLACCGRHDEAIAAYEKYLSMSKWQDEKYSCLLAMANCYGALNQEDQRIFAVLKAVHMRPDYREAYLELADLALQMGDPKNAIFWSNLADAQEKNNLGYKGNPFFLESRAAEVRMHALAKMNRFEEAIVEADKLLATYPGNHRVLGKKTFCACMAREQKLEESWKLIENALLSDGTPEKLKVMQRCVPEQLLDSPLVELPSASGRKPDQPTIAFYCDANLTPWSYDSIERGGVGGSETAVIRMAEALAAIGWNVEVYGYPEEGKEGLHNGVWWFPFWRIAHARPFDVLINWRRWSFKAQPPAAKVSYVWCHDVLNPYYWPDASWRQYKGIIVLSEAHKANAVEAVPMEKLILSRNGLDPSFWSGPEVPRDPHRLIYASCPSRGLVILADLWPRIKAEFPDAELDVFYGFNNVFLDQMRRSQEHRNVFERTHELARQRGVNYHGMVDQATLGAAFRRAGLWAYPCTFPEISCITAMQAQACGAVPVTTRFWALDETVRYGLRVGDKDLRLDEMAHGPELWLRALRRAMDPAWQETIRKDMVPWAQAFFPWEKVAREWDRTFKQDLRYSPVALAAVA